MGRIRVRTASDLGIPLTAGIALLSLPGCATPFWVDPARDAFPEEQVEVAEALGEVMDAARRKDADRLDGLHLYGPKFTKFDDWEPLDRQDAETARKIERDALASLKAFRPSVRDLKVDVFGPVAVATFVFPYEIETAEGKSLVKARSTIVFVRDRGRWKIAHEHHSAYRPNS